MAPTTSQPWAWTFRKADPGPHPRPATAGFFHERTYTSTDIVIVPPWPSWCVGAPVVVSNGATQQAHGHACAWVRHLDLGAALGFRFWGRNPAPPLHSPYMSYQKDEMVSGS